MVKQNLAPTLLAALICAVSFVFAQTAECPNGFTVPRLCGSESYVASRTECNSSVINFPDMKPCCRLHTEVNKKCDDPNAETKCRSVEISPAACPGENNQECCFKKDVTMKLHFAFDFSNKTCCSNCRCYGDPHCESFKGLPDTWVICDARDPKSSDTSMCPMSQEICQAQLDHTGNPCNWNPNYDRKKDSIALNGSPCRPAKTAVPPQMSMYKSDNFNILLNMGERSIIEDLIIVDGPNQYVLNAQLCFDYAYINRTVRPWRTNYGPTGVIPSDPDWLPKKWIWSPLDGNDVVWETTELLSMIDITIRCTRTPERVGGVLKYGAPRLNVDIVEPLNWEDPDSRPRIDGLCPVGKIAKQGSTAQTDMIDANGYCTADVDNLATAQVLCGAAVTKPGVPECMLRWCKDHLTLGNSFQEQQQCINDIGTYGWSAEFCALNVFGARFCTNDPLCLRTAVDCKNDGKCRECMNAIKDDGWKAAVARYDVLVDDSGNDECKTRSELFNDLIGCEKGVKVQYQEPGGTWVNAFSIPSNVCVKGDDGEIGVITITKTSDPNLLYYPMRIIQCSEPPNACLLNKCSQEIGFKSHVEIGVNTNEIEKVWNLYEAGILICDPQFWATPTACLDFTPPKMCPCRL